MLTHPTHDRLIALGLAGMAKALEEQRRHPDVEALSFEERLGLLVDREAIERENKRLGSRLKFAGLRQTAIVEDTDMKVARGLDKTLFAKLIAGDWITRHQNLAIIGKTGLGKSWLACALGHKACRDDRSVLYHRVPRLFDALALARGDGRHARLLKILSRVDLLITGKTGTGKSWLACALGHKACRDDRSVAYHRVPRLLDGLALARGDGRYARLLKSLARVELLILDDWGLAPLTSQQGRDLLEIVDDRHGRASTILTSQLPVANWHDIIVDPTIADAVLDRLVHTAHRLALDGETLRKPSPEKAIKRGKLDTDTSE